MPDPFFYLHHHTSQEVLADLLLGKLQAEGENDPFFTSRILVRNQGMATWLRQWFARKTGLAMQVEFPQPGRFLEHILGERSVGKEELLWSIYRELPRLPDNAASGAIHRYLIEESGEPSAIKRYQLAGQLSNLFDKYLLYRPDWIHAWNRGEASGSLPHEPWQRELWQKIARTGDIRHWTQTLLESGTIDLSKDSGAPLHVFGISHFAPIYVHFLYLLSQQVPVHIYWMNPVAGYWGDGPTRREWILAQAFEDPEILTAYNPLLASFGRMGREFIHTTYGGADGNHEVQEEEIPAGSTAGPKNSNLGRLQAAVHDNKRNELATDCPDDVSITIHSCHTPMRELQVLKDYLLTMAEDQPLDTGDVLILCPDIRAYAPVIEAVFGAVGDASANLHLPYQISDRFKPLDEPAVGAVIRLLKLGHSRFTNSEALALLSTSVIAARFALDENDLGTIQEWVTRNGIRWGFDAAHVNEIAPSLPDAPWTWQDGLERMLLGYAMPRAADDPILWEGILPFHDIEGDNVRVLDGLCSFIQWCTRIRRDLTTDQPLTQWVGTVHQWIDQGYDHESARSQELLRPLLRALDKIKLEGECIDEAVPAAVFAAHLEALLGDDGSSRGFLSGSITFCEMKPMRAIPARIVCMLGMNYDSFPRQGREIQFDLTLGNRRIGDRLTRDDDCYAFLEALLSARESLFVSFIGKFVKDGKERPPSTALQTLIDCIPGGGDRIRHEKLHAFDPSYFQPDAPRSHQGDLLEAARTFADNSNGDAPTLRIPGNDSPEEPPDAITVNDFVQWFTKTSDMFMRRRLRAQRCYLDAPMEENETLEIAALNGWRMKDTLLNRRHDRDDYAAAWRQQGIMPAGALGDEALEEQLAGIEDILREIPEVSPMEISIECAGLTIHGNVPLAEIDDIPTVVVIDPSSGKAQKQLTTWIFALLASSQLDAPVTGRLYGMQKQQKGGGLAAVLHTFHGSEHFKDQLEQFVELWRAAHLAPLPHFPRTAAAYVGVTPKEGETEEETEKRRREAASKEWDAGNFVKGESEDEAIGLLFPPSATGLFSEAFRATSRCIWEPLIAHRHTD